MKILQLIKKMIYRSVLFIQFIYLSIQHNFKSLPDNSKNIFFTLDDDDLYRAEGHNGRYAYLILNRFSEGGYSVYFYKKIGFRGFIGLGKYGRLIYTIKNLKIIQRVPPNTENMIYAFDYPNAELLRKKWKKLTYVNVFKPTFCKFGELISIPYFLHPQMYALKQMNLFGKCWKNKKRLRIFFGGNTVNGYYSNPDLKRYNQLTRLEAIHALLEKGGRIKEVKDMKKFLQLLDEKNYINECYLLRTDRASSTKPKDWLSMLSKSDFFLCLSGTDQPMCHNAIEALAIGLIPIISYPDWFFPPLEHGKNAILYKPGNEKDLLEKIEDVFNMGPGEIVQLRQNATEYYQKHLTSESFIRQFETSSGTINTVILYPRLVCSVKENEEGDRLFKEMQYLLRNHRGKS